MISFQYSKNLDFIFTMYKEYWTSGQFFCFEFFSAWNKEYKFSRNRIKQQKVKNRINMTLDTKIEM